MKLDQKGYFCGIMQIEDSGHDFYGNFLVSWVVWLVIAVLGLSSLLVTILLWDLSDSTLIFNMFKFSPQFKLAWALLFLITFKEALKLNMIFKIAWWRESDSIICVASSPSHHITTTVLEMDFPTSQLYQIVGRRHLKNFEIKSRTFAAFCFNRIMVMEICGFLLEPNPTSNWL